MTSIQRDLIERLHELLLEINEQALNDDDFYEWLNENYFFEKDLEEIIVRLKKAKEKNQ